MPRTPMNVRQGITAVVLLLLVALAAAGLVWTREQNQATGRPAPGKAAAKNQVAPLAPMVDQSPLQTAHRLAALAAAPEELNLVHQAEKVADHELDLTFYDAERNAGENPPALTPEATELATRRNAAETAVKTDEDGIAVLNRTLAAAPASQKEAVEDQLEVAKAQLELDQYEVDDASEDLERAGADPAAKVRRLKAEHDASDKETESATSSAATSAERSYQAHTLLSVFRAWSVLHSKRSDIVVAGQEAAAEVVKLNQQHEATEKHSEENKSERDGAKQQATSFSRGEQVNTRAKSRSTARIAVNSLKQHSQQQKNLTDLDKRIQDEQELVDIYGNWAILVQSRERAALHNTIETMLWILIVALVVYLTNLLIGVLFAEVAAENKRITTMQTVARFAVQAAGGIAILFVIFGMPSETTTILGLAGAGLTVALKDFIVAFFGWFVLMGRNGIRAGDWVEINGVSGEVVDVGLLRTVLLETGNWTDSGHPTGRKVAFVNGFAIEGHFFNFSTSGQWMWDELQVDIPANEDPYPIIDGIQKLVEKDTSANSKIAQQEWQHATTKYRVQALSAVPGINVRPTGAGIEINVRYITRAYERHETRTRLNQAVVELMHGKRNAASA